jgi:hypothetical protein
LPGFPIEADRVTTLGAEKGETNNGQNHSPTLPHMNLDTSAGIYSLGFDECFGAKRDMRMDFFNCSIVSSDSAVAAASLWRSSTH